MEAPFDPCIQILRDTLTENASQTGHTFSAGALPENTTPHSISTKLWRRV